MPYHRKPAKPARPEKPAILATAPRPGRVAKGNAQTTIRNATVPKSRAPRAPATNRVALRRNLPFVPTDTASSGESLEIDDSLNDRETLMEDIRTMIQGSISEAFAFRDGKKRDGNLVTNLPPAPVAGDFFQVKVLFPILFPLSSPPFLYPNMFSLVGTGSRKIRSRASQMEISRLTIYQNFTAPTTFGTRI